MAQLLVSHGPAGEAAHGQNTRAVCVSRRARPTAYAHMHVHVYVYAYVCMCVCAYLCMSMCMPMYEMLVHAYLYAQSVYHGTFNWARSSWIKDSSFFA